MCSERQIQRFTEWYWGENDDVFGNGGKLLIMAFMEIILGKEKENVREKKRSIVVAGKRLFC